MFCGDSFARIKSPFDRYYSRYSPHLGQLLVDKVNNDELTKKSANEIYKEANGGHDDLVLPFHIL